MYCFYVILSYGESEVSSMYNVAKVNDLIEKWKELKCPERVYIRCIHSKTSNVDKQYGCKELLPNRTWRDTGISVSDMECKDSGVLILTTSQGTHIIDIDTIFNVEFE